MSDYLPPVVIEIVGREAKLTASLARATADIRRFGDEAVRQSAAAAAASGRTQQLLMERERLAAAERASVARKAAAERSSVARRAAGEITAAERAAEKEQIAAARATEKEQIAAARSANRMQIEAARTAEREQVAAARRASAQVTAAQREQAASAKATAGKVKDALGGIALGAAAIGVESIKMASKFDAAMTMIHTQAGVSQSKMAGLKQGVLALAGKVGQDPDSLAESLYHVESNFESMGISSSKALKLVETAAKGATTGHANLVDVTNALTAAVASGIPGVQNFGQAMGVLNATVGVGDMKMQDLASAFGSGMVATVKGFGLSIQDVGAALATFGDNNIRGSLAGNQLRMSVMALAKPVSTAHEALKKLGLQQDTLAKDMQKGGLKLALTDLMDHMKKAGISSKEQGQIITDAFGRKAGAGLNILVGQFDRLKSKYPALQEGANKFGKSWTDTTKTFSFQMKQLQGEFDSFMIRIGEKLIPYVQKFVAFLKGPFADAVGPVAKAAFDILGSAGGGALAALSAGLKIAAPFLKDLAAGMQATLESAAPFVKEMGKAGEAILNAIVPSNKLNSMEGPLARLRDEVRANKGELLEAARVMGNAMIDMAKAAITSLPLVVKGFRQITTGVLDMVGVMVDGAAKAFGWVPGLGGKLKNAAKGFDGFKDSVLSGLDKAQHASESFAKQALPKLEQGRLKLNIDSWQSQISAAKDQLKSVPSSKRADIQAKITDLQSKVDAAKRKLGTLEGNPTKAQIDANIQPFFGKLAQVKGAKIPTKTGTIAANSGPFWSGVQSLIGRVLGTSYVNVAYRKVESSVQPAFHAAGGPIHRAAGGGTSDGGGRIVGPGSGTSDSIPAMLSNGEYVVRASSVQKYGQGFLDALNSGRLRVAGFARGGLSQSAKDARNQLSGGFGISYFGRLAGYQRTGFEHNLAAPTDVYSLVDSLNGLSGQIKKAFSGHTESSLLRQLDKAGKSLIGYDKQLTKVTSSLASAKTKLDDLKNSAAQLKSSVSSSIMQGNSIVTQAPQAGFALSSQDVLNNMASQLSSTLAFSNNLQALKKKGLSADLLQQIASAGVDQGGATAAALMGASASQIKQLNSMQSQMKKSADAAGSAVADSMYGAGIKAAEGLVKGLEKQQKHIEDAMLRIAKSMEKAIKHALGIKSPSTVMAQLGDYTALGLAHGIQRSSKHATIAARGLAMSVYQGAAMTGSSRLTALSAARAGGGGVIHHHHYEFHIEGNAITMDRLAKDVEAAFLRRGMRNPATYPAYKR